MSSLPLDDDDSNGQPHVDPDRVPTAAEGVPVTMRDLVFPPDAKEAEMAWRAR